MWICAKPEMRTPVLSLKVDGMTDASRWKTFVHADDAGQVLRVVVNSEHMEVGRWVSGYADVSASMLSDKDEVRRLVREAIGTHVMNASVHN